MRIAVINTFESGGGAAIAANRLIEAIETNYPNVVIDSYRMPNKGSLQGLENNWRLLKEKLPLRVLLKNKENLFKFSLANSGLDISKDENLKKADIIHLHWVNQGFLSLANLESLKALKKPIVWTLHDMWPFTGGCHHSRGCKGFATDCSGCHYLRFDRMSKRILSTKKELFSGEQFHFVACSNWLADLAKQSSLGIINKVSVIPNPIAKKDFELLDKEKTREDLKIGCDKFVVLFSAAFLNDPRKGLSILLEALAKEKREDVLLLLVGQAKVALKIPSSLNFKELGFVSDINEMNKLINTSDLFISTSLEENLPNSIMESLAAGTPTIAFDIGGIEDLVVHKKNGLLVDIKGDKVTNFANALDWFYTNKELFNRKKVSEDCFAKFSYQKVAKQYMTKYQSLLK